MEYGVWHRPRYVPYLFGVYRAAQLAKSLGQSAVTAIEFGVAGGNGLLALQEIAAAVAADTGVRVVIAGFDSGEGMPAPLDYRDLPHVWRAGFYRMDVAALRPKLLPETALFIGDVRQTAAAALDRLVAPIGFISFDLDFYSSTRDAFSIFDGPDTAFLPRIYCYFDDVVSPEFACHSEYTGELLAIKEYNEGNDQRKIAPLHLLRWLLPRAARWQEQMYVHHSFQHASYTTRVMPEGSEFEQLPVG